MAKFKKGDRVRYLGGVCGVPIGTVCIIDEVNSNYPDFHAENDSLIYCDDEKYFELIEDKPMKYAVGQVLENNYRSYDREIIANFGDKALMTIRSDNDRDIATFTITHLEDEYWHLKTTPENTEMTVKEIEDKLGVKNLKVVKE